MSGNVLVGDHILMAVGLDSAGRQLERLARDGVLLSASEHAYGEGITGLVETAGLAAGMRVVGIGTTHGDLPGAVITVDNFLSGELRQWMACERAACA